MNLKDFKGGIADCSKAIELNPLSANAYSNRGGNKNGLKDYVGQLLIVRKL